MALEKVHYVDRETVITADNLNQIQDEIIANAQAIEDIQANGTGGTGSGVYVGTATPPASATVWIDPSGEPSSTEDWVFEMEDGTTETKTVVVV